MTVFLRIGATGEDIPLPIGLDETLGGLHLSAAAASGATGTGQALQLLCDGTPLAGHPSEPLGDMRLSDGDTISLSLRPSRESRRLAALREVGFLTPGERPAGLVRLVDLADTAVLTTLLTHLCPQRQIGVLEHLITATVSGAAAAAAAAAPPQSGAPFEGGREGRSGPRSAASTFRRGVSAAASVASGRVPTTPTPTPTPGDRAVRRSKVLLRSPELLQRLLASHEVVEAGGSPAALAYLDAGVAAGQPSQYLADLPPATLWEWLSRCGSLDEAAGLLRRVRRHGYRGHRELAGMCAAAGCGGSGSSQLWRALQRVSGVTHTTACALIAEEGYSVSDFDGLRRDISLALLWVALYACGAVSLVALHAVRGVSTPADPHSGGLFLCFLVPASLCLLCDIIPPWLVVLREALWRRAHRRVPPE